MGIIEWLGQRYLQNQKEKQARKLAEVRKALRKLRSGSPQLRSMVQPELTRVDELNKQLRKVRSREDLRRWHSLYNMCLPAFEVALNLATTNPGARRKARKRGKGRRPKSEQRRLNRHR